MSLDQSNVSSSQLSDLKAVLEAQQKDTELSTGNLKNVDVIKTALVIVSKMEHHLSLPSERRTEIPLGIFEDNNPSVQDAFLMLFDYMFFESSNVREACYKFFGLINKPPRSIDFLSKELTSKMIKDGAYNNWMSAEIRKGNGDALKTWNVLIRIMGRAIHQPSSGVTVLNSLLQIVELAFKNPNQEMRKNGYLSWRVLMDNFALDEQVLTSSKRIKLITRPLVGGIGNKCEMQINSKFDTWWYYISLLNKNLRDHIDSVVVPFLTFCYSSAPSSSGNGTPNQHRQNGLQSPAKRFVSIRTRCLEATAILLGGLNNVRAARLNITNLECFAEGVLISNQYVNHHKFFLWCAEEALGMLNIHDRTEINYFTTIFQSIVRLMEKVINNPTYQTPDYIDKFRSCIGQFFLTVEKMICTLDKSEDGCTVALLILQELKRFPVHFMTSTKSWPRENSKIYPPATTILKLMLKKDFILTTYLIKNSTLKDKYLSVFEKLISTAASSKENGLAALNVVLNTIKEETSNMLSPSKNISQTNSNNPGSDIDRKNAIAHLWKIVAAAFKNYIDKYSEVNQSKTASLDHDLTACKNVLLHPFQMFPDITAKVVWNKWTDLYRQINMLAALVVTYKSLELERYLSQEGIKLIIKPSPTMPTNSFVNFCQHLSQQMVSSIPYPTFQGHDKITAESSIQDITPVIGLLVELCKKAESLDLKDRRSSLTGCSSLCLQLTNLLANISNTGMIRPLIKQVVPALVVFLNQYSNYNHGFEKQIKDVYEQALNQIQARYDGHFSKDFLAEIKLFLTCALSHGNRDIRSRAHQMWQLTFANSVIDEEIPKIIKEALTNYSGIMSYDSTISSSSQSQNENDSHGTNISNPLLSFGNFFDKNKPSTMNSNNSPVKSSTDTISENPKTPTSATKWAKPKLNTNSSNQKNKGRKIILEDESSQDFVKISSPTMKKRPLTDHQKDILSARRDDIPALYSESSRDDSQIGPLPEQFQSQNLISLEECDSHDIRKSNKASCEEKFLPTVDIKIESNHPDNFEDILSTECSMSIIDPRMTQKPTSNKKKMIEGEIVGTITGGNVKQIQLKAHGNDDIMNADASSQSSAMEESFSSQDDLDSKTSSSRRKLRMPKKNAQTINKISPAQRRKSGRNLGVSKNKSSREMKNKALESVDKENKASCIVSNVVITHNQEGNVLPCITKQSSERRSIRRSSSTSSYSPVVSVTPGCKRKFNEGEDQTKKHISIDSELEAVGSLERKDYVLMEIGEKLERKRKSSVHSANPTNKGVQEPFEKLHNIFNEKHVIKSKESKVHIERLSPENEEISSKSPVKIVNESPLKIVPVNDSVQPSPVARRINFDDVRTKINNQAHSSDSEGKVVNNSQHETEKTVSLNIEGKRSRKRRNSNSSGNASKRAKTKISSHESEYTSDDPNIAVRKKSSDSGAKRSKRIARKVKKVDVAPKSDNSEVVAEIVDTDELQNQANSVASKNTEKGEKQIGQKMRLNKYGESPLHVAVKRGDIEKVQSILSEGADANSKDHAGWRPIHEAMREGENALRIIRLLVDHGADINAQSDSGNTALHDAAAYMSQEIIEYLIKSGANPSVENLDGKSPFDIAKMPQYAREKQIWQILSCGRVAKITNTSIPKEDNVKCGEKKLPLERYVLTNAPIQISKEGEDKPNVIEENDQNNKSLNSHSICREDQRETDNVKTDKEVTLESLRPNEQQTAPNQLTAVPDSEEIVSPQNKKSDAVQSIECNKKSETINISKSRSDSAEKQMNLETQSVENIRSIEGKDILQDCSEFSTILKIQSESHYDKAYIQCTSEELNPTEKNVIKQPTTNSKSPNENNQTVARRLERRNNVASPFGPSRGAKLLQMANKKSKLSNNLSLASSSNVINNSSSDLNSSGGSGSDIFIEVTAENTSAPSLSKFVLMSPRIESRLGMTSPLHSASKTKEKELLATPKSLQPDIIKPWQKFVPSPSSASPTASILKRTESPVLSDNGDSDGTNSSAVKRRRVKFTDPPVSEQVEIPRSQLTGGPGSGGACITGPNKAVTLPFSPSSNTVRLQQRQEISKSVPNAIPTKNEGDTTSNYNSTDTYLSSEKIADNDGDLNECIDFPLILKSSKEPISSLLTHLTNKTFYKAAKKSLEDNGVETIEDLCKLSFTQIGNLKGLKPPSNAATIKEAMRKFEKVLQKREIITMANNALYKKSTYESTSISPKEAFEDRITSKLATAPFMESTTPDEEDKALKEIYERPSPSPTEIEQDIATDEMFEEESMDDVPQNGATDTMDSDSVSLINEKQSQEFKAVDIHSIKSTVQDNQSITTSMESVSEQLNAFEAKPEISTRLTELSNAATQTAHPKLNVISVETSTNDIAFPATVRTSEAQAVVSTESESCQAIVDTIDAENQTDEQTNEIKAQQFYMFLETLDAKTLATVNGKCHAILQEKINKL